MSYTYFKTLEGFWQLSVHIHAAKKDTMFENDQKCII